MSGCSSVALLHADPRRTPLVLLAELADGFWKRRREKRRLARARERLQDLLDVGLKAHVEHAVGFVEHDRRDAMDPEGAAPQVVEHPPRRSDRQVRSPLEALRLLSHRLAAGQQDDRETGEAATELAQLASDLRARARAWGRARGPGAPASEGSVSQASAAQMRPSCRCRSSTARPDPDPPRVVECLAAWIFVSFSKPSSAVTSSSAGGSPSAANSRASVGGSRSIEQGYYSTLANAPEKGSRVRNQHSSGRQPRSRTPTTWACGFQVARRFSFDVAIGAPWSERGLRRGRAAPACGRRARGRLRFRGTRRTA